MLLQQQRVVQSKPPDPLRVGPVADEVTYRLVERGGLAHSSWTEHQLEAVWLVVAETAPQQLGESALDGPCQRIRYPAVALPRILLVEDPLQVLRLRAPDRQRQPPFVRLNKTILLTNRML